MSTRSLNAGQQSLGDILKHEKSSKHLWMCFAWMVSVSKQFVCIQRPFLWLHFYVHLEHWLTGRVLTPKKSVTSCIVYIPISVTFRKCAHQHCSKGPTMQWRKGDVHCWEWRSLSATPTSEQHRGSEEHKIFHLYEEYHMGVLKSQNVLGYIGGCIFMSRLNLQSMQ